MHSMRRRWIIRSFFIALCEVCVGVGWGVTGRSFSWDSAEKFSDHLVLGCNDGSVYFDKWNPLLPDGWIWIMRPTEPVDHRVFRGSKIGFPTNPSLSSRP